jgi:uncharacterized protein (TIGR03000 family)
LKEVVMFRRACLGTALTALAVLLWNPAVVLAQRHGGGGAHPGGGARGGGEWRGGGEGWRGGGWGGEWGHGEGGEWTRWGLALGLGGWPGYYRWADYPYGNYGWGGSYGSPYYYNGYSDYPPADYYAGQGMTGRYSSFYPQEMEAPASTTRQDEFPALVSVRVPADAEVFFDGDKTQQKGSYRLFVSPPLHADNSYNYKIRAHWKENGKDVDQTRTVPIHAGDRITVNFIDKARSAAPAAEASESQSPVPEQRKQTTPPATPQNEKPKGTLPARSELPAIPLPPSDK